MSKLLVTEAAGESPVPFLRGILTRSLIEAGLPFDDAYQAASEIRQQLEDVPSISNDDLRALVLEHLRMHASPAIAESYEARRAPWPGILVRDLNGELRPFSSAEHRRCLAACGLDDEQALNASNMIFTEMGARQWREIAFDELHDLSQLCLDVHFGRRAAERYRIWTDFLASGRPLVLLIGGVTGSGKSTIATELAQRFGIVRTQSTDMLREVMRMLIPDRLLPVLHRSSFDAGGVVPEIGDCQNDDLDRVTEGYRRQLELLALPCEAVIVRAIRERVSLIVEGVHVHPTLAERCGDTGDAVLVPMMLGVLKPEQLRSRLSNRGRYAPGRGRHDDPAKFRRIWHLQAHLLDEADRLSVPILINDDRDKVTTRVLRTVIDVLDDAAEPAS